MIVSIIRRILRVYDLRTGGLELRATNHNWGWTYSLYGPDNRWLMTAELKRCLAILTAGMNVVAVGDIAVLSRRTGSRYVRNQSAYTPEGAYKLDYDPMEPYRNEDNDRYDNKVNAELLPDYHINLRALYPGYFPEPEKILQYQES